MYGHSLCMFFVERTAPLPGLTVVVSGLGEATMLGVVLCSSGISPSRHAAEWSREIQRADRQARVILNLRTGTGKHCLLQHRLF